MKTAKTGTDKRKRAPAKKTVKPKSTPKKLKLMITIVNRAKGEFFADLITQYSVNLQLLCAAKGTANSDMLRYLGLVDSDKAVIFSVVREDMVKELSDILEEKFKTVRNGQGIAFTVPFSSVIGVLTYGFLSDNRMTIKEDK